MGKKQQQYKLKNVPRNQFKCKSYFLSLLFVTAQNVKIFLNIFRSQMSTTGLNQPSYQHKNTIIKLLSKKSPKKYQDFVKIVHPYTWVFEMQSTVRKWETGCYITSLQLMLRDLAMTWINRLSLRESFAPPRSAIISPRRLRLSILYKKK